MSFKKRQPAVGAHPGTLVIPVASPPPRVRLMHYTEGQLEERPITDVEELRQIIANEPAISWVDVQGYGEEKIIRHIAEIFELHPLAIEDIVNVPHRPSADLYDDQLLLIIRMPRLNVLDEVELEQVSILLGKNYVVTFQERYGDVLDPVRNRLRSVRSIIRRRGAEYLAYAILDTIIDAYYPVLETVGDYLDELEEQVIESPRPAVLHRLHRMKRRLIDIRRSMRPQRDAIHYLFHESVPFFGGDLEPYVRDTFNHCVQSMEVVEMYRETVTELTNIYLSSVANRTNDIMRTLTVMASIFIPLTFLAGVYGMNFDYMPELRYRWSYPVLWVLMLASVAGMLFFFHRKGWLGDQDREE